MKMKEAILILQKHLEWMKNNNDERIKLEDALQTVIEYNRLFELKELLRKAYKVGRRNALKQDELNFNDFINKHESKLKLFAIPDGISHFNLVADVMPARNEYVLIKTPYCEYPATVGFWDGVKWLAADDMCEIFNVSEWRSLNEA